MWLGFSLQQEQSQKLLMTAQMQQAIAVLQCSALELIPFVQACAADNPCLEVEWPEEADGWLQFAEQWDRWSRFAPGGSTLARLGDEWDGWLEQVCVAETTLYDELALQLKTMRLPEAVLQLALHLIGSLDESGYLRESDSELARLFCATEDVVAAAVAAVQSCYPRGIGARTLQECLLLQLDDVPVGDRALVEAILRNHLEDVAAGRFSQMAKRLKCGPTDIQRALDAIRKLQPRPGMPYGGRPAGRVVPDVMVEAGADGYFVHTNDGVEPVLRIHTYRLNTPDADGEVKRYLRTKVRQAVWIARCVEQRRRTILAIAEAIVRLQPEFFREGRAGMRPLTMRQVAGVVGVHESTVSRAIRGKYMATPQGMMEMKQFFSAELGTDSHEGGTSATAAKVAIRRLIQQEDGQKPLSDEAIARALAEQGIHISRRTVAKYRDELRIPAALQRRRFG
ncbi:RNA polymerase sigma-54 factor [Alicyclobacillus contaminans]|uniref:RNA polymerase factor sigma-54 n=1 Tax=Alicyclobacillus contaminans TaxID=392016 RepID=UPI0003F5C8B5|nr:RNA polymerase factor sigma-54 [Alicyclobacillus contaminans]GMA49975.1 RNA polymerase sigma-54 factor [Alicyclobacillus contaminans]